MKESSVDGGSSGREIGGLSTNGGGWRGWRSDLDNDMRRTSLEEEDVAHWILVEMDPAVWLVVRHFRCWEAVRS